MIPALAKKHSTPKKQPLLTEFEDQPVQQPVVESIETREDETTDPQAEQLAMKEVISDLAEPLLVVFAEESVHKLFSP